MLLDYNKPDASFLLKRNENHLRSIAIFGGMIDEAVRVYIPVNWNKLKFSFDTPH